MNKNKTSNGMLSKDEYKKEAEKYKWILFSTILVVSILLHRIYIYGIINPTILGMAVGSGLISYLFAWIAYYNHIKSNRKNELYSMKSIRGAYIFGLGIGLLLLLLGSGTFA